MKIITNKIKKEWKKFTEIAHSEHEVALGFAVGTFIAIFPTPGFNILIGFLILYFYKKMSRISFVLAYAVWNPLVLLAIYGFAYTIGERLFTDVTIASSHISILDNVLLASRSIALGLVILGVVFGIASYILLRIGLKFFGKKKETSPV